MLIGVLLAVAAMPVSSKQQKKNTAGEQSEDMQKSVLEEKLEAFLENTEGVGKVQVILMTDEKKDRQSFYNSETIQVTGVLISAEGGGNPVVVQNIQEAVMALFQVDAHRIRIMKMNEEINVKKVIGKNQVIITSLAILIAVAGYLNFADVDLGFRDKEASTDSSSILEDAGYDLTDETALLDENQADGGLTDNSLTDSQETDTPGEAVFTGSTGFAAQAKISREQVRSQNKADLQDIINNEEIDDEEKQEAIHTMVSMTDLSEKEAAAELLLEAKGFKNVVVNLTGETADVVIPEAELSDAQRAQIEDIVKRKTGIAPENIVITPLKESEDAEDTTQTDETSADTSYEEDSETSAQPYEDTAIDTTDIYD